MRLLKFDDQGALCLTKDLQDELPSYAILSHTWGNDEDEVTFDDLKLESWKSKAGYEKIRFCGEQARKDKLEHFWVDTCCIDKANNTEYSEAIVSMYRWYRGATKCYVYLSDVSVFEGDDDHTKRTWKLAFRNSRWFKRGWTLQELLAPASVDFFSQEGEWLGDKNTLEQQIHNITGISVTALRHADFSHFSVNERMQWAASRETKKVEDQAYCLLGIFNVSMPIIYGEREKAFPRLLEEIAKFSERQSTETIDTWIREKCYSPANLKIERLSGEELPMDQCYINLAMVQHHPRDSRSTGDQDTEDSHSAHRSSSFSLLARLHVEDRNEGTHIALPKIFDSRRGRDGYQKQPRRILIHGQAGIGKTTLCKKMVYDFSSVGMWKNSFSRILWIPLRKLKGRSAGYKIQNLFSDVFFPTHEYPESAARELHKTINNSKSTHTLFVLDGLDEVSQEFERSGNVFQLLLYLLNWPNVIITSRPYGVLPSGLDPLDLKLETIGFYPEQVKMYLKRTFPDPHQFEEVHSFIQDHWLLASLVRIPIQLDALCLTWDDANTTRMAPETMTTVYRAIEQKLWKKDLPFLEKMVDGKPLHDANIRGAFPPDIEAIADSEIYLLEILAFTGLHNDVINFDRKFLDMLFASAIRPKSISLPGQVLAKLSFIRTSDPLSLDRNNYHFLHLTFQEYFAARYFVRQWRAGQPLQRLHLKDGSIEGLPHIQFLQKYKYSIRYNIIWRFVAGLLQSQEADLVRFFEALEEPPDLLGSTHQRLVMYCLSEVTHSDSQRDFTMVREQLEKALSDWLHFQCNFCRQAELAREMEFPENVVSSILQKGPEEVRVLVLESLARRPRIQLSIVTAATSLLNESQPARLKIAICGMLQGYHRRLRKDVLEKLLMQIENLDSEIRLAALEALQHQSLSYKALERVGAQLKHPHWDTRNVALKVLQGQSSLSDKTLEKVVMQLDNQDWNIRQAALEILQGQSSLSDKTLEKVVAQLEHQYWTIRQTALEVLQGQSSLSDKTLKKVVAKLEDQDQQVRSTALEIIQGQSSLSDKTLENVVTQLDDQDWKTRYTALQVLQGQSSLSDKTLEKVVMQLDNQDWNIRQAALKILQGQSSLSDKTLEKVVAQFEHQYWTIRQTALKVLQGQSSLSDKTLEKVVAKLEDQDQQIRSTALEVLQGQSSLSDKTLENVVTQLDDQDQKTRYTALEILQGQYSLSDKTLKKVVMQLDDQDWNIRYTALQVLQRQSSLSDKTKTLEKVVMQLDDQDWNIRYTALQVLQRQSSLSNKTLKKVVAQLEHQYWTIRQTALKVLQGQSSLSDKTLEKVVAKLEDQDQQIRSTALEVLQGQSSLSDKTLEKVVMQLDNQDWNIRQAALKILQGQSSLSDKTLEKVVAQFEHQYWTIRQTALEVLQGQSSLSDKTLEKVVAKLKDQDQQVRSTALEIIQGQSSLSDKTLENVVTQLDDQDWKTRYTALQVLQGQYSLSDKTLEKVVMQLDNQDWNIRQAALKILQGQSSLSDKTLEKVVAQFKHQYWTIRQTALKVLQGQSSLSDKTLEKVVAQFEHQYWTIRQTALEIIQGQSSLSDKTLENVVTQLDDQDWKTRYTALQVLQGQSSLSDKTLEKVVAQLEDQDWQVRDAAYKALQRQSSLSDNIVLNSQCLIPLYKSWLWRSIREPIYGSITNCVFSLNTTKGVQTISFKCDDDLNKFRDMVKKAQSSLGVPKK